MESCRTAVEAKSALASRSDFLSLEALLVSRAYLYELFHKVFGGEPSGRLLELIGSKTTIDVLDEYADESGTMANLRDFAVRVGSKRDSAAFIGEVSDEFARFFEGPADPPAYPWESTYVGDGSMVFQPSTLVVREAYRTHGLQVSRLYHVPDDHVSIMCAFMAELSRRALKAFRGRDTANLRELLAAQRSFAGSHMVNWLPRYAEGSLRVSKAHLYPHMAQGVSAFVALDAAFCEHALAWTDGALADDGSWICADYDSDEYFGEVETVMRELREFRPRGIEDNELKFIEPDGACGA